ncbi:hypothetical protein [Microbispora sp. H13382]|uniref:hypothetical protein n=1 Tax=Microbispora sp. H13382 TaxID=2729112 RepID=UPI001603EA04|nr:hypothetical protein [Microbispora sp. H13382]
MTATDDQLIPRNPCRVRGADEEKSEERPVLTVAQVFQLADLGTSTGTRPDLGARFTVVHRRPGPSIAIVTQILAQCGHA